MFRSIVAISLIAGLLAGQLAARPHAHGYSTPLQQQQHDVTPHFHFAWFGTPSHDHGHSHSKHHHHHGHSHSHHGHSHYKRSQPVIASNIVEPQKQPTGNNIDAIQHDADAVYLTGLVLATVPTESSIPQDWAFIATTPVFFTLEDLLAVLQPAPRWHPPDKMLDDSNIYLTTRNLRI